ncbi:MAG: hypothetical protein ABIP97_10715 [Chthoniobacterales bacterium]
MKNTNRKSKKIVYSLGELVAAISSCAENKRESLAALIDLLESGKVRFLHEGRLQRVRVAM